jgi:tight adherence protein B
MDTPMIIAGMLGFSIFITFFGLSRVLGTTGEAIDDRLGRYATREGQSFTFIEGDGEEEEEEEKGGWFRRKAKNPQAKKKDDSGIVAELAKADLKLTASEWTGVTFGSVIGCFILGLIIFRSPILAAGCALFGFFLPRFYLRARQGARLNAFNRQLADGVVLLSNSLRAGYSFLQSVEVLSREMPPPVSTEFGRVVREVSLGLTTEAALNNLLKRVPSQDLDMMITAINVQQEVGGNLAEILDMLAHTIRERVRILGEIKTLVAQQKLSGNIITVLPFLLAAFMFIRAPKYMEVLYTTSCGWIMVGTAIIMIMIGWFAIQKIVSIEV